MQRVKTRVMPSLAGSPSYRTIAVEAIEQEHRALTQVVELLRHLLHDIQLGYTEPDFHLLSLALYYLEQFPGTLHHSKEDDLVFTALRRHTHEFDALLDDLAAEHRRDAEVIGHLYRLVVLYQAGAPGALIRFRDGIERYAEALREHIGREEALLSRAGEHLPEHEWHAIAEGFARSDDPLFGVGRRREFAVLHHRIMNLLPRKMRVSALGTEE